MWIWKFLFTYSIRPSRFLFHSLVSFAWHGMLRTTKNWPTITLLILGILIMNAIIIQTLKNSGYNFANRTSNMKRISFKRIDSYGGNNAQQNGHCNRRHSIENQNGRGDNNSNNNILNEKNSNECNMCRFHQEHDRDEVSSNKAKSISSVNKNLDGDSK